MPLSHKSILESWSDEVQYPFSRPGRLHVYSMQKQARRMHVHIIRRDEVRKIVYHTLDPGSFHCPRGKELHLVIAELGAG